MKRLFLSILPLLVGCALSAQTYHDGVWYSLYDDATHTMNTQDDYATGGVFAPTTGTLNVKWRYEWIDWLGAFAKIDTEVLTSADNGDNTTKVGKLAENTGKNSNTTESFSVGRDINWMYMSITSTSRLRNIFFSLLETMVRLQPLMTSESRTYSLPRSRIR